MLMCDGLTNRYRCRRTAATDTTELSAINEVMATLVVGGGGIHGHKLDSAAALRTELLDNAFSSIDSATLADVDLARAASHSIAAQLRRFWAGVFGHCCAAFELSFYSKIQLLP